MLDLRQSDRDAATADTDDAPRIKETLSGESTSPGLGSWQTSRTSLPLLSMI